MGFVEEAREELLVVDADRRALFRSGSGALVGRVRSPILDNRMRTLAPGGASLKWAGRRSSKSARAYAKAARTDAFTSALRDAQSAVADPYALRKRVVEQGRLGRAPSPSDLALWKDAHPIAFPDVVRPLTAEMGVPPYFLYAIMTIESAFHAHPVSVSDAYGLIQVIPRTGRNAARELGVPEFSPERLFEPAVGLRVGTWYLARLLRQFAGQEPLAAAAYNCGPHRVMSWLASHPDRPLDAFIEEIPYGQARNYAKRAIEVTAAYRRTWHGEPHMYVSNHLEARFLPEPNY
jgi:soluble lytic murein transglycosylase